MRSDNIGRKAFHVDPWQSIQEVDNFISETVKNFTGYLLKDLEQALPELQVASTEAEAARTLAISILLEIDSEKARVVQTLRDLPWWDRFTFAHFLEQSCTSYFREYLKFFDNHGPIIRYYVESIQIVADNILMLIEYVLWYRRRQVCSHLHNL